MTETYKVKPDHILTRENITGQVIVIPIEAALDQNTGIDATTTGAGHDNLTPPIEVETINLATTLHIDHISDHPHIEALQGIDPESAEGHIHDHPTGLQDMNHIDQVHNPAGQDKNHIPRRT